MNQINVMNLKKKTSAEQARADDQTSEICKVTGRNRKKNQVNSKAGRL